MDATIKAIEEVKPAMIVLTSPNNPTGTPLKMDDLKRVLGAAETAEVAGAAEGVHPVVVVDEATSNSVIRARPPRSNSSASMRISP